MRTISEAAPFDKLEDGGDRVSMVIKKLVLGLWLGGRVEMGMVTRYLGI